LWGVEGGRANHYRYNVRDSNSGRNKRFLFCSLLYTLALRTTKPLVQWVPGIFPGGKSVAAHRWPSPPPPHLAPKARMSKPTSWFSSMRARHSPGDTSICYVRFYTGGPGSSGGIATGYGLDGPGIESWWGRDCSHLSRPVVGPTKPPVQ
jgi:hypothetical protein